MNSKIPCVECGTPILPATAAETGGKCMPCKRGIRKQMIEDQKRAEEAKLHVDPFRVYWKSLVDQVYKFDGFEALSHQEKVFWCAHQISAEVLNGGWYQYFYNSSGAHFAFSLVALQEIGATKTIPLLTQAKRILFGRSDVPEDSLSRRLAMPPLPEEDSQTEPDWSVELSKLDSRFYEDPSEIDTMLVRYAAENSLFPFTIA